MQIKRILNTLGIPLIVAIFTGLISLSNNSFAMTSFSRQTGLPCTKCHYTFPELTPFGRKFKLNGYTLTGMNEITAKPSHKTDSPLGLLEALPLSVIFRMSETGTNRAQPGTQNWNVEWAQAINIYLAGAMTDHAGATLQLTYAPEADHITLDNSDFRYARQGHLAGKPITWGLNFDNNPTQEDLWNDTTQWGFPWVGPDSAPFPMASPIVGGTQSAAPLSRDVGGAGIYAMWNNHLYGDLTLYRSMQIGTSQPPTGGSNPFNIRGVAPYWRVAWQQLAGHNYFEIGTYGMHMSSSPFNIVGPTDFYTDAAVDGQFERQVRESDEITIHSAFIHQNSDLIASASPTVGTASFVPHHLNAFKLDGTYHFGSKYAATVGEFSTYGTTDPLLFAAAPLTGSSTGSPKSNGTIFQFGYWPYQNIMITAQYTAYANFNGGSTNYDGSGRNASDNNAAYVLVYFTF
jgi:hypothetical protein